MLTTPRETFGLKPELVFILAPFSTGSRGPLFSWSQTSSDGLARLGALLRGPTGIRCGCAARTHQEYVDGGRDQEAGREGQIGAADGAGNRAGEQGGGQALGGDGGAGDQGGGVGERGERAARGRTRWSR